MLRLACTLALAVAPADSAGVAAARPPAVSPAVSAPGHGYDARRARSDALAVRHGDAWHAWWSAERAPVRWHAALPVVAEAVAWTRVHDGVELGELRLAGAGEAWRTRVILVRLDPRRVRLALDARIDAAGRGLPWRAGDAPADAVVALNAGQFTDDGPWGWVVHRGREHRAPGTGALAMALAVDSSGSVRWARGAALDSLRASGRVHEALQSYPALLVDDGTVPESLRHGARDIDLEHRDARLAIGELRDGRLLVALTRFDALGAAAGPLPFGPTVPGMAALMGALGARTAMMLDGGLSAQLLVRPEGGAPRLWPGLRAVPLGFVARPRHMTR